MTNRARQEAVILDEKEQGVRYNRNIIEPLSQVFVNVFPELSLESKEWESVRTFINDFIWEKKIGVTFHHEDQYYSYRARIFEDQNSFEPEFILNMGNAKDFLKELLTLNTTIEENRSSVKWLVNNSCTSIWERATFDDLNHPVQFMKRIVAEITDTRTLPTQWTRIGSVETKRGLEDVYVMDTEGTVNRTEGPRMIRFASTMQGEEITDITQLPGIVYGLDNKDTATLYSIQLPPIDNRTPGGIQTARNSTRILTSFLNKTQEGQRAPIPETDDLETIIAAVRRIQATLTENDFEHIYPTQLINLLSERDRINIAASMLETRDHELTRFNSLKGGSALVSMISFIALVKQLGIKTIRIPILLPLSEHYKNKERDALLTSIQDLWVARLGALETLTGISPSDDVAGSHVILDIQDWSLNLQSLNRKSRQIAPLLRELQ